MERVGAWKLLRTKTDETSDDTDYVGTNTALPDLGDGSASCAKHDDYNNPITGIEVAVLAVTSDRVPVDRETPDDTVDLQLVEEISRTSPSLGGTVGDAPLIADRTKITAVALQSVVYFPLNGSPKFTIRVTNDASLPATTDRLEIWWREVSR